MVIRLLVAASSASNVGVGCSPLSETVLSWRVLLQPTDHLTYAPWLRRCESLPANLREEVRAFAFAYAHSVPGFLVPSASDRIPSIDEELERLRGLPHEAVGAELIRPLAAPLDGASDVFRGGLRPEAVVREARAYGRLASRVVRDALDDPEAACLRFIRLVGEYWNESFDAEWARLRPLLEGTLEADRAAVQDIGVQEFVAGRSATVGIDGEALTFPKDVIGATPNRPKVVSPADHQRLLLTPSVFLSPHLALSWRRPWPCTVFYPTPVGRGIDDLVDPPRRLAPALKAVSDENRLRLLGLLAAGPLSTSQLASRVGKSEPAVSKQVKRLERLGLLEGRRDGYYVVYSVRKAVLADLADDLVAYLCAAEPEGADHPDEPAPRLDGPSTGP